MINDWNYGSSPKEIITKELKKIGLEYIEDAYSKKKNTVTLKMGSKIINYLKSVGEFRFPTFKGNEYFLEYNTKSRKFGIIRSLPENSGDKMGKKWVHPVLIRSEDVLKSPIFIKAEKLANDIKRNSQEYIKESYFQY